MRRLQVSNMALTWKFTSIRNLPIKCKASVYSIRKVPIILHIRLHWFGIYRIDVTMRYNLSDFPEEIKTMWNKYSDFSESLFQLISIVRNFPKCLIFNIYLFGNIRKVYTYLIYTFGKVLWYEKDVNHLSGKSRTDETICSSLSVDSE